MRHLIVLLLITAAPFSWAQSKEQASKHTLLTLPERERLALPILNQAASAAVALEPGPRSLLLYRTAGAWLALDRSRAIRIYREAFAAARECDPAIRKYVEEAILNDLLPLSPTDVLDLLPNAESEAKNRLYGSLINFSLFQGDYKLAARAFDDAIAAGVLPERATVHLLASLPQGSETERNRIFVVASRYYEAHPDPESFHWTLADLIARFYAKLPAHLVLQAIGTLLAQAEEQERQHSGGTGGVASGENSIDFHSAYDFQLFAAATALQHLDPDRAGSLLSQHPEVAADLKRYPEGLASLYGQGFRPEQNFLRVDHRKPQGLQLYNAIEEGQNLSPLDMGLEFAIPRNLNTLGVTGSTVFSADQGTPEASILSETGTCPADVSHRLELARTVPVIRKQPFSCSGPLGHQWCSYIDTFPRSGLIQAIAERCTYNDDPVGARRALHEQLELLDQIPEEHRIDFLATAADLYLRLGDRQSAADVLQKGFVAARGIYKRNLGSVSLEKFPQGIWPSAEAYRRMITLGVTADLETTRKAIDQIPDPGLAELERTMLARSLLGVPVRRYMEMKPTGSFCTSETDVTYDQF